MTKFICETKNLSKKYKDFYALKNVNLTIPKGEIYGLVVLILKVKEKLFYLGIMIICNMNDQKSGVRLKCRHYIKI